MGLEALLSGQVIGLSEAIDDRVNSLLQAGSNITLTYNDGANTLTIAATGGSANCQVDVFTSSGTWTKPANCKLVRALLIGGGGGGGSGRRGATGTIRGGGGGGGARGQTFVDISPDELGATESVTVGAGGAGGAAVTVDDTNGNAGTVGGETQFGNYKSQGGGAGTGGIAGNASGGSGSGRSFILGTIQTHSSSDGGSGSGDTQGTAPSDVTTGNCNPLGGGGGGSISSGNAFVQGRNGAGFNTTTSTISFKGGGARSTAQGVNGGNAVNYISFFGTGAGGGYGGNTQAGTKGGNGIFGSGGGGGGGSTNGYDSGAGGDGGNGIAVIISFMGT